MNCGGALLSYFITDATPLGNGFAAYTPLTAEDGRKVTIRPSLPATIDPEWDQSVCWTLQFRIPFALLEKYMGCPVSSPSMNWRGNFYKCAENNSHPHWASWQPLPELNFHQPGYFGSLEFVVD
jgi:hypothetical protein